MVEHHRSVLLALMDIFSRRVAAVRRQQEILFSKTVFGHHIQHVTKKHVDHIILFMVINHPIPQSALSLIQRTQ
jgi:CRP-like cAMP-binding protein